MIGASRFTYTSVDFDFDSGALFPNELQTSEANQTIIYTKGGDAKVAQWSDSRRRFKFEIRDMTLSRILELTDFYELMEYMLNAFTFTPDVNDPATTYNVRLVSGKLIPIEISNGLFTVRFELRQE